MVKNIYCIYIFVLLLLPVSKPQCSPPEKKQAHTWFMHKQMAVWSKIYTVYICIYIYVCIYVYIWEYATTYKNNHHHTLHVRCSKQKRHPLTDALSLTPATGCWRRLHPWDAAPWATRPAGIDFLGDTNPFRNCPQKKFYLSTIWLFNIAMKNDPFIDGLPIKNGDFPWLC